MDKPIENDADLVRALKENIDQIVLAKEEMPTEPTYVALNMVVRILINKDRESSYYARDLAKRNRYGENAFKKFINNAEPGLFEKIIDEVETLVRL